VAKVIIAMMNEDGSTIIKIFVQFRDKLAAHNARSKLHKRRFGGKIIHAQTYDEKRFAQGDYTA